MKSATVRFRAGDMMVTTSTRAESAIIDFAEILKSTTVVSDDCSDPPWETSDGLEHRIIPDNTDGKASGTYRCHGRKRVVLDHPEAWGNFEWHRAHGASKQAAYELTRQEWKRTREYIAGLRESGWNVFGVMCDFQGEQASLWGIDAANPPTREDEAYLETIRLEVAESVVHVLEQAGFIVINQPVTGREQRDEQQRRLRNNLHVQDWK